MRVASGLTQEALAEKINKTKNQVQDWESSVREMRADTLFVIARATGHEITVTMREDYEERAAIMEYDGGLKRGEAERKAAELVLAKRRAAK